MATAKPPRMTRAHFEFLAELLRKSRAKLNGEQLVEYDARVTYPTANALGETNPDFDLVRFLRAVGARL